MPNNDKPIIESFSVDVDQLSIPEEAKGRLIRSFQKSLLQELVLHDNGLSVVVFDPRHGGRFIKNAHLAAEMKLKDLLPG